MIIKYHSNSQEEDRYMIIKALSIILTQSFTMTLTKLRQELVFQQCLTWKNFQTKTFTIFIQARLNKEKLTNI